MLASCFPRTERKQAVRPFTHPATVAFGLANLYLLDLTGPLIATDHDLVYHLIGSASSVILPIIVYVVALSLSSLLLCFTWPNDRALSASSSGLPPPSPPALCSTPSYKSISKPPPTLRPGPASKNNIFVN
jgi:hypothetical protein